jgi:hypothetical protein
VHVFVCKTLSPKAIKEATGVNDAKEDGE